MLNKTSLQDQVFSFGKNNIFGIEGKAKDFTNDSDEKFNNKMKESEQLRGRALKKQAENTGSPDIPGNGKKSQYYTPPPIERRSHKLINFYADYFKKSDANKNNNYININNNTVGKETNHIKNSNKNEKNFEMNNNTKSDKIYINTNLNNNSQSRNSSPLDTNNKMENNSNFFLKNASKILFKKIDDGEASKVISTGNYNARGDTPLKINNLKSNDVQITNKKVLIIDDKNDPTRMRDKSWSYLGRKSESLKKIKVNNDFKPNKSRGDLNYSINNYINKSFSNDQYSEFMRLKSNGMVKDSSVLSLTSKYQSRGAPFLKLKEKLSDNFMHFLKKHRFSALMIGNTLYHGKSGNFFINMKKNKEGSLNKSNVENEKDKFSQSVNDINLNDTVNVNEYPNNVKNYDESFQATERKFFDEKTNIFLNNQNLSDQLRLSGANTIANPTNAKDMTNTTNNKTAFDVNIVQENYKNYKDSLTNNNNEAAEDSINLFTNQTEEKENENLSSRDSKILTANKNNEKNNVQANFFKSQNQVNNNNSKTIQNNLSNKKGKTSSISSSINLNNTANKSGAKTNKYPTNSVANKSNINNIKLINDKNTISNKTNVSTKMNPKSSLNSAKKNQNNSSSIPNVNGTATMKNNLNPSQKNSSHIIGNVNGKSLNAATCKKSSSQTKINEKVAEKYSLNLANNKNSDNSNHNNLNISQRSSSTINVTPDPNKAILRENPRKAELKEPIKDIKNNNCDEQLNNTFRESRSKSRNNLDKNNMNKSFSNNNFLNSGIKQNNGNSQTNIVNNNLVNSLNTSRYHTLLDVNNGKDEFFNYEKFRNLEKVVSLQKGFVDLTPIPMKKEDKKNRLDQIEYYAAERAAVLIRRIEYSHNLKNMKFELSEEETRQLYVKLLVEAKTIIIQRWWRKMLRRICVYHLNAQLIQSVFRGYIFRVAFNYAYRNTKYVYPFISTITSIVNRNMMLKMFHTLYEVYINQKHFEYILKKINLISQAFRKFNKRRKNKLILLKKFVLGKDYILKRFIFDKFVNNKIKISKTILIQKRIRGMLARDLLWVEKREIIAEKLHNENKQSRIQRNSLSKKIINTYISNKKSVDIRIKTKNKINPSIMRMIQESQFIKMNCLLKLYLACQRLHTNRKLGYREFKTQKAYLLKFVEIASHKFLHRKKVDHERKRNNSIENILYVREKYLKKAYFKKFLDSLISQEKLAYKTLLFMKTVLKIIFWNKLMYKFHMQIIRNTAFKCIKNYLIRSQKALLLKKFKIFKFNTSLKARQDKALKALNENFNKKLKKDFFTNLKNSSKLSAKRLKYFHNINKLEKVINKIFIKNIFYSLSITKTIKRNRFVGALMNKILIPQMNKILNYAFKQIMLKSFKNRQNSADITIGGIYLQQIFKHRVKQIIEKLREYSNYENIKKYIAKNYAAKDNHYENKEKNAQANAFTILSSLISKHQKHFFGCLRKTKLESHLKESGAVLINKILLKKMNRIFNKFVTSLSNQRVLNYFRNLLLEKKKDEKNIEVIHKGGKLLEDLIMRNIKTQGFSAIINLLCKEKALCLEDFKNDRMFKIKEILLHTSNNINQIKKLYLLKYLSKMKEIIYYKNGNILASLGYYINKKIKFSKLKSLFFVYLNLQRKKLFEETSKTLKLLNIESFLESKNSTKLFRKSRFSTNDALKNEIRYKLILLGNKLDNKYILKYYFNKLKLCKISYINKIILIQKFIRKIKHIRYLKHHYLNKLLERLEYKHQKMKEKYFYKFTRVILDRKYKTSAITLKDFMKNYTRAAKIIRLYRSIFEKRNYAYFLSLKEKFYIWRSGNVTILYSNNTQLLKKKIQVKNHQIIALKKNEEQEMLRKRNTVIANDSKNLSKMDLSQDAEAEGNYRANSLVMASNTWNSLNTNNSNNSYISGDRNSKNSSYKNPQNRKSNFKSRTEFTGSGSITKKALKINSIDNHLQQFPSIQDESEQEYSSNDNNQKNLEENKKQFRAARLYKRHQEEEIITSNNPNSNDYAIAENSNGSKSSNNSEEVVGMNQINETYKNINQDKNKYKFKSNIFDTVNNNANNENYKYYYNGGENEESDKFNSNDKRILNQNRSNNGHTSSGNENSNNNGNKTAEYINLYLNKSSSRKRESEYDKFTNDENPQRMNQKQQEISNKNLQSQQNEIKSKVINSNLEKDVSTIAQKESEDNNISIERFIKQNRINKDSNNLQK